MGALLEEERRVEERAARAAVLLVDGEPEPAEVRHLAGHVVVMDVLEAVGELLELLLRELALAEVTDRADEVLLLVAQREVVVAHEGRVEHYDAPTPAGGCAAARPAPPPVGSVSR